MLSSTSIDRLLVVICIASLLCAHSSFGQESTALTWVAGDTHLHATGCNGNPTATNEEFAVLLEQNNLNVGSVLVWGIGYDRDVQSFTGHDHPVSTPEHILHYDLEVSAFRASHMGHLNILGLSDIEFSDSPFSRAATGLPIVDWSLAQNDRVIVGMNHGFAWPAKDGVFPRRGAIALWEFPVHVANGTASFLEEEAAGLTESAITAGTTHLWRVLQNSGFRVALAGGSDFGCVHGDLGSPEVPRTLALVEGGLTYDSFLDSIRAGRTEVSVGGHDRIDFSLDGVRLGGELKASAGTPMQVAIDTNFSEPGQVRIMVNGELTESLMVGAGPQLNQLTVSVEQSSWITAQSTHVQTSPIYAIVDEKPIRASAEDASYLARYMDIFIDKVRAGKFGGLDPADVVPTYRAARDLFKQRFFEAGGTTFESPSLSVFTHLTRDTDQDGTGDQIFDLETRGTSVQVGVREGLSSRLFTKFLLPEDEDEHSLKQAKLRFFLERTSGTSDEPVSLYHNVADNEFGQAVSDHENAAYLDTFLELVQATDTEQAFYELDVTELVKADYAHDTDILLSAFQLRVSEAAIDNRYNFTMPNAEAKYPQLFLTFIPEPSSIMLVMLIFLPLTSHGWKRQMNIRPGY
jgi:hypothetical protein